MAKVVQTNHRRQTATLHFNLLAATAVAFIYPACYIGLFQPAGGLASWEGYTWPSRHYYAVYVRTMYVGKGY